jgi:5-formyltetrahydrofolate cyclo-ligase
MDRDTRSSIPCDPRRRTARQALRGELLASRQRLPDWWRAKADEGICERLRGWLEATAPGLVGVYWPVNGEPDLGPLLRSLPPGGFRLALPVVDGPRRPLRFVAWRPGDPTVAGAYGIPRPLGDVTVCPEALVIPCVGFDARCFRIGYGGGFYDRTLAMFAADVGRRPLAVGVSYDEGEVPDADPQAHDIALDAVVTPTRVLTACSGRGGSTR